MTLACALQSKLNEMISLPEKLTLVKKLQASKKLHVSNKSEIIINWLFESIQDQFSNLSFDETLLLWSTLNEVLEVEASNNQVIYLKPSCIKVIIAALKKYSFPSAPVSVIFNCLITFLQSSSVNNVIVSDGDALLSLLFTVLDVICKLCAIDSQDEESFKSAKLLVTKILDLLDNLPFSVDESKIPVFSTALPEIASFTYFSLTRNEFTHVKDRLIQKIHSVIFNSKTKLYESLLESNDETEVPTEPNKNIVNFFVKLQNLIQKQGTIYDGTTGAVACAALMKKFLCGVFIQNKSGLEHLKVLALFFAISGLDIPLLITADSCCNKIFEVTGKERFMDLNVVNKLLEACADYPQHFSIISVPEGHLKPSDWLEGITAALLDAEYSKNKCAWIKCFRYLLKISVSVVENNVTSIIKSCLLNITVHSADSKQEYCNLFKEFLSLHSRLHQLPKFFVKLLLALAECIKENSAGKCVLRGQIFPDVLESLASHVQELPFGQVIELWKILSETYTTFISMSQIFPAGKGGVLFVAQLFSTFLLHSKLFDSAIPLNAFSKFGDLMQHTTKEMKSNISILSNSEEELMLPQRSFLLLCYALGEIKIAYSAHKDEPLKDPLTLRFPDCPLDCSLLLSFLDEEHTDVFEMFLKSEDKVLSFLVYILLIQKIRGLIHKKEISDDETAHLQKSISFLLHHASENINSNGSWDFDVCTLDNKNYGSAVWRILLKYFSLILNYIPSKELLLVCGCFKNIILQESSCLISSEMDLKSIVLSELRNPYFQDSKDFQTTFTASLWKFDPVLLAKKRSFDEMEAGNDFSTILSQLSVFRSKWIQYAESTPKCNKGEELNPMWTNLKEACISLNQLLESDSVLKIKLKSEIYSILQLIDCLPLEYLLPGNQMRCIIGLSILLFLTPECCKANEAVKVAGHISKQLIAIFDGARSIWLFDFVTSGPYVQEIVNTIDRLMDMKQVDESFEWPKFLLNQLIGLITKNSLTLSAAESYFSKFFHEKQITPTEAVTFLLVLEKLSQVLRRAYMQPQFKEVCERLATLACSRCVKFLNKYEGRCDDDVYSTLIQCYMEVIEIVTLPSWTIDQKKKDKCLAQLPKILQTAKQSISDQTYNHKVYFKLFAKVFNHLHDIESYVPENFYSDIWESINFQLQQHCSTKRETPCVELISFDDDETELLQSVFLALSEEKLNSIFEDSIKQLNCWEIEQLNTYRLQINLNVLRQIIESDLKRKSLTLSIESILSLLLQLNTIVNQANDSELHLMTVKLPVLDFINFLVKLKRSVIPRQSLIQTLHFCVVVKLQDVLGNLSTFAEAFNAALNVVYNLLTNHVPVVLSATAPFLSVVTNLLKSIVQAGSQEAISTADSATQAQMLLCAQNMDRLLTMISRHKTEFAKLVPYLVADYVDSVQHITLESNIKSHLLSGINRLLRLCSEDNLKMVAVNINHSCRDIYSNIVKNYNQYRYHGDV